MRMQYNNTEGLEGDSVFRSRLGLNYGWIAASTSPFTSDEVLALVYAQADEAHGRTYAEFVSMYPIYMHA